MERPSRQDAYEALAEMDVQASKVKALFRKGNKGFNVDFYDECWKKHVLLMVNKFYHAKYWLIGKNYFFLHPVMYLL